MSGYNWNRIKALSVCLELQSTGDLNQWIDWDPFFHWKGSWKNSEREYLTEEELQLLIEKEFDIPRLEQVNDIFLFCCYTGLA